MLPGSKYTKSITTQAELDKSKWKSKMAAIVTSG